jgi:hypothetical protein
LTQAVNVLKGFYQKNVIEMEKEAAATFVQISQEPAKMEGVYDEEPSNLEASLSGDLGIGDHEAPPAGFSSYKNQGGNTGVIAMITQIIQDAKAMEAETIRDEQEAQRSYEDLVKETNDNINQRNREIVGATGVKAQTEQDLSNCDRDLESTTQQIKQLVNENADLHKSCDYVMKNFDIRQEAMGEEVEALRQAKAILSGADFQKSMAGFLQAN